MYLISYIGSYLGVEVHQPTSRDRSLGIPLEIQEGSRDPRKDPEIHERSRDLIIQKFYIRLGRYLLNKNFMLNSNNILIYWYSFTSNKLYFQV
jgi:hypothetical protein